LDTTTREAGAESQPGSVTVEYGCQTCHDAGWVSSQRAIGADGKWVFDALPCPQCRPLVVAPIGVPDGLKEATFTNFDLKLNPSMRPAFLKCKAVAEGETWCALLIGPPGRGKSHLAVAALNQRGGAFWEVGSLLRNMRQLAFADDGPRYPEERVVGTWMEYRPLLVLDDLGAEKLTEWAAGTLYSILNARYQAQLPTIITSNVDAAVDDRTLSRYASGVVAIEGGQDIRRRG
jgi:DNA replication protein DnaC